MRLVILLHHLWENETLNSFVIGRKALVVDVGLPMSNVLHQQL